MSQVVIVDSGPLVAHYCVDEKTHVWVRSEMARLTFPLVTCEAVLTETCLLLARARVDPIRVIKAVQSGFLKVDFEIANEAGALETLMKRYTDTPMSLADACLVRLSEMHKDCLVFTLDSDFKHYRRYGRSVIPLLSPW